MKPVFSCVNMCIHMISTDLYRSLPVFNGTYWSLIITNDL